MYMSALPGMCSRLAQSHPASLQYVLIVSSFISLATMQFQLCFTVMIERHADAVPAIIPVTDCGSTEGVSWK